MDMVVCMDIVGIKIGKQCNYSWIFKFYERNNSLVYIGMVWVIEDLELKKEAKM